MKKKILCIIILILVISGGIFAFQRFSASAREMKLVQTEGGVHVSDDTKQAKPVRKNMNLYSGYGVSTETASYAWIDLDKTKLLKMDEASSASLLKDGQKLRIELAEGNLFFCVTKPLDNDEALEFETSNMAMSVRGTTGVVRIVSEQETRIIILEGAIEGVAGGNKFSVSTGETADIITDDAGKTSVAIRESFQYGDVPDFAVEAINNNKTVKAMQTPSNTTYMTMEMLENSLRRLEGNYRRYRFGDISLYSDDDAEDPYEKCLYAVYHEFSIQLTEQEMIITDYGESAQAKENRARFARDLESCNEALKNDRINCFAYLDPFFPDFGTLHIPLSSIKVTAGGKYTFEPTAFTGGDQPNAIFDALYFGEDELNPVVGLRYFEILSDDLEANDELSLKGILNLGERLALRPSDDGFLQDMKLRQQEDEHNSTKYSFVGFD